jgi:phosphopantetheinyl transferase
MHNLDLDSLGITRHPTAFLQFSRAQVTLEIHFFQGSATMSALTPYLGVLSPSEKSRGAKFVFERHAAAFQLRCILLRHFLAERLQSSAEALEFGRGPYGKPFVLASQSVSSVAFNLSHSADMLAIAVSSATYQPGFSLPHLGVDIELRRALSDSDRLPEQVFHPDELVVWRMGSASARQRELMDAWVTKEALLKCAGVGLALEPCRLNVGIEPVRIGAGRVTFPSEEGWLEGIEIECAEFQLADRFPEFALAAAVSCSVHEGSGKGPLGARG